jgi:pSer/pThr/pTyr-binding forkhead associated (FHA) protein
VTAQELLDALNEVQNKTDLEPTALWALSEYLREAWKEEPGKSIRPFDLGKILSDFFVDLTHHRLPPEIAKRTPETEQILQKFFGSSDGRLSKFWAQCIGIWSIALESQPAFGTQVTRYLEMLMQSSLTAKPAESPAGTESAPALSPSEAFPPATPTSSAEEKTRPPLAADLKNIAKTPDSPQKSEQEPQEHGAPKNAFLVLQGTRVIPLNQPVVKIGRRLDNHIILQDPRVSRSHAEIKLINDRFVIFDLNSTGGTYVNGRRSTQSVLYPGDVISLAGVIFIYSQEMPARPGDVKVIELGSPFAADRPTVVMKKEELKHGDKAPQKGTPELPKTGPLQ